jgi:mono/diheme cytochrome c family protein
MACSREEKGTLLSQREAVEHGPSPDWNFTLSPGEAVEGRKVFVEFECYKCHEIKGEEFPSLSRDDKGLGPELSQMARHPLEFLVESIVNPNAVLEPADKDKGYVGEDGKSKMPNFNEVLTVKQVTDLAAYLKSLGSAQNSSP